MRWITLDCHNRIYAVVNGESSVRIVDRTGKMLGTAARPDEVAAYFPKPAVRVDAHGDLDLSGICKPAGSSGVFDPSGAPLDQPPSDPPTAFKTSGTYWSEALDSRFSLPVASHCALRLTAGQDRNLRLYLFERDRAHAGPGTGPSRERMGHQHDGQRHEAGV